MAASYWSLLAPAIEMATESRLYGPEGEYAFAPVALGFLVGAAFVYGTDALITSLGIQSPNVLLAMQSVGTNTKQRHQRGTGGVVVAGVKRFSRPAKVKSDKEDFDDDSSQLSHAARGAKFCSQVESTTIDGIPTTHPYTLTIVQSRC